MVVGCKCEVRRFFGAISSLARFRHVTLKLGSITSFKVPQGDGFSLTDPCQTLKKPWKGKIKIESLRLTDLQCTLNTVIIIM